MPRHQILLIAGRYTTRATVAVARKFGKNVLELDVPSTLDQMRAQIMRVADVLNSHDRGVAMIADFDRRIAALPPPPTNVAGRSLPFTKPTGLRSDPNR